MLTDLLKNLTLSYSHLSSALLSIALEFELDLVNLTQHIVIFIDFPVCCPLRSWLLYQRIS